MKKLLAFVLLSISLNCHSATWKMLSNGWEVDTSSIQKSPNGITKAWFKRILSPEAISEGQRDIKKDFSNYSYSLTQFEYNCNQKTSRVTAGIDYASNSSIINSFEIDNKFSPIYPESNGELNFLFVCRGR